LHLLVQVGRPVLRLVAQPPEPRLKRPDGVVVHVGQLEQLAGHRADFGPHGRECPLRLAQSVPQRRPRGGSLGLDSVQPIVELRQRCVHPALRRARPLRGLQKRMDRLGAPLPKAGQLVRQLLPLGRRAAPLISLSSAHRLELGLELGLELSQMRHAARVLPRPERAHRALELAPQIRHFGAQRV